MTPGVSRRSFLAAGGVLIVGLGLDGLGRAGAMHERTARPLTSTVHAPHWASPQPKWVPVSPRSPRST